MKSPILGGSYLARSTNAAANRCMNLFPESVPEGGKDAAWLMRCPGLNRITTVGSGPIRGMWQMGSYGYVVSGYEFYKITTDWEISLLGPVNGTGPVSMSDNGTQIFIACSPSGFIYDTQTGLLQEITDPDFPGAVTVSYIDGYFVFNEPGSQKIWVTALLDGTQIDALEFASAEGSPDNVVALIADHREVWVFGTNSVEVWYDSGALDFPLERLQGAFNEIGCTAPFSIAKLDNGLFWLGSDSRGRGIVYRNRGYTGVRISTHALEFAIQNYGPINDAVAYTYQQEGHSFYVLTFPLANKTWVYDASTEMWHERGGFHNGQYYRHRSNCRMVFADKIIVGDFENGNIYFFDLDKYTDNGFPQRWTRAWRALPPGQNNLKRTVHHALQIDCESGVPLEASDAQQIIDAEDTANMITENMSTFITEDGRITGYSQMVLRWSDDGGHTWSNWHKRSVGILGETWWRVIWRRLGMTLALRDRVYELSGADPVKIAIMGAELTISPTNA